MKKEAEKNQLRSSKCRVNVEYSHLIARCRYNDCFPKSSHRYQLVARNRIDDEQKGFFSMHSYDYEERILKPTTRLFTPDICDFVQSFGHLGYQRQVDFNQVTCSIDDLEKHVEEIKPHAGLGDLLDIKSKTRKRFIFMPIREARSRNSGHFSGVAVDIEKRLILFFDSRRRYAIRDGRSRKAKADRVTGRVRETMSNASYDKYWRCHEVDFISQTDVTSCDVFL